MTVRRAILYLAAVLILGSSLACSLFPPSGEDEPLPPDTIATTPAAGAPAAPQASAAAPGVG